MQAIYYKKPTLLAEIPDTGHVVIEASAGTGKTYTLRHLVVDLLLADPDCQLENLLVVTFTRRATAELRAQVRQTLHEVVRAFERQEGTEPPGDAGVGEQHGGAAYWHVNPEQAARLREAMLGFDRAEIFTIHSFCQKLLTENAFRNHQLFSLEMVDEEELFMDCAEEMLRTTLSVEPGARAWFDAWVHPAIKGSPTDFAGKLFGIYRSHGELSRSDRFPDACETVDELMAEVNDTSLPYRAERRLGWQTDILGQFLKIIGAEVARRKREDGLYTFDDMLRLVAQSLERADASHISSVEFARAVRAKYKYALIDEFQDTDPVQWQVFKKLFVDNPTYLDAPEQVDGRRLFLIGDPKQAIYKFRGADVWTYLSAVESIQDRGGHIGRLETNYRSTRRMIAAYNSIFEEQTTRADSFFTNEQINYQQPVKPSEFAGDGIEPPIIALEIAADDADKTEMREAWLRWMAEEIASLVFEQRSQYRADAPGSAPEDWSGLKPSDIYVLTYSNADSHKVGRMLQARGVPYAFYRQDGLFQTAEARDILDLLRGILQPDERPQRRAAFRTPFFAVPIAQLARFDRESKSGEEARDLLKSWQKSANNREFHRFFRKIMDESGILRREILLGSGERALTNYSHLMEILSARAASRGYDLGQLTSWLGRRVNAKDGENSAGDEDDDLQRLETDAQAVQIMTMHKSKGLQAEVVFVYGGYDDRLSATFVDSDEPGGGDARKTLISYDDKYLSGNKNKSYQKSDQRRRIEEQAYWDAERLMYVAITRAKSRLYLCYASREGKKSAGRGGAHKALARSLDRLSSDAASLVAFVPLTLGGGEGLARASSVQSAGDAGLEDAILMQAGCQKLSTAVVEFFGDTTGSKYANPPIPWGVHQASARDQVSFSGVKKYMGDKPPDVHGAAVDMLADTADEDPILDPVHQNLEAGRSAEIVGLEEVSAVSSDRTARLDPRFEDPSVIAWGGTQFGSFIHEVLEQISDYSKVLEVENARIWARQPEIRALLERMSHQYGINPAFAPYNARILFDTLRTPLELPGGGLPVSIAEIARFGNPARELDFLFPIPELSSAPGPWPERAPRIDRGWVEGSIDLVFEHEGRVYIADWKTNQPESFAHAELAAYTDQIYSLQAQIYTLAAVRLLGITNAEEYRARFGGCAYLFVRAMAPDAPPGTGVLWARPTWEQLHAWHHRLASEPTGHWKNWHRPDRVFRAHAQDLGHSDPEGVQS